MPFALFQTTDKSHNLLEFDGYIDLGKELSILQALLSESMEKCNEVSLQFHHQVALRTGLYTFETHVVWNIQDVLWLF